MQDLQFPLKFKFNVTTLANDFTATDSNDTVVAYVRQKMFKLKEDIQIFDSRNKSKILYSIKADRWLDFSAAYSFYDTEGNEFGKVVRKGWKSIWKAEFHIMDSSGNTKYSIREDNPWIRVADSLLGGIPILGLFMGYMLNPKYLVRDTTEKEFVKLVKEPSFFGRKFSVQKLTSIEGGDEARIILGLMMMILLERKRG